MTVRPAGDPNWEEEVLGSPVPVLVQFWRETCPVCKAMEPVVQRLAVELEGRVPVFRVDVDAEEDLVWAYGVMSTPTFIVVRDGEPLHTLHGEVGLQELRGLLEDAMAG